MVAPEQVKNVCFRSCCMCQGEDHLSYQRPTIPKDLEQRLKRQGLVLAEAVNWADRRTSTKTDTAQVHEVRVAALQSITEALSKVAPTGFVLKTETSKEISGSRIE